jgi:hypothetical protein
VKVEGVEIREVDPAGKVKDAMEEQTSAERLRRAAILKADGQKKAAILNAEGEKRSKILQAEGTRQSRILVAEGQRVATILESQGEAQRLRIMSLGAAPLDSKALTVLSLDTVKSMSNGQATKIIFPFELTRLMEGASEYLGIARQTPARDITNVAEVEKVIGKIDTILGPIPTVAELKESLRSVELVMEEERIEAEALSVITKKDRAKQLSGEDSKTKD